MIMTTACARAVHTNTMNSKWCFRQRRAYTKISATKLNCKLDEIVEAKALRRAPFYLPSLLALRASRTSYIQPTPGEAQTAGYTYINVCTININ